MKQSTPLPYRFNQAIRRESKHFLLVNEQMDDPETMRVMVDRKVKVGRDCSLIKKIRWK